LSRIGGNFRVGNWKFFAANTQGGGLIVKHCEERVSKALKAVNTM
jgi:hypothetical protein